MTRERAIELLWYWQNGGDSFTCQLFSLYAKADSGNRKRIEMGFPVEVAVYNEWAAAECPILFFKEHLHGVDR